MSGPLGRPISSAEGDFRGGGCMRVDGLFDISGRTALVTGSSRGIGRALAEGLYAAGCTVVLNGRDEAALEAARSELAGVVTGRDEVAGDVAQPAQGRPRDGARSELAGVVKGRDEAARSEMAGVAKGPEE